MNEGLTIEATIQDIEHDQSTGWYTIVTEHGKFSTKIRENAEDALRLRGKHALITYTESVVTKPTASGEMRTYRNRYLSRASEAPAAAAAGSGFTTTGAPQSTPEQGAMTQTDGRKTPKEDAWRMCLSVGAKCAVDTLALMPNEQRTFETQKTIALAWAKFLFFTPMPVEIAGTTVPMTPTPQAAYEDVPAAVGGGYDVPEDPTYDPSNRPPTTDDIPY